MKVSIHNKYPSDIEEWNNLCITNGNLIQSTQFDTVQQFFKQIPVYFEITENSSLVGGVKFYYWESTKLGTISRLLSKSLLQHGEFILKPDTVSKDEAREAISVALNSYLFDNGIVNYTSSNFYGDIHLLIKPTLPFRKYTTFNTGYVDIDKSETDMLLQFNRNTRRNISNAVSSGCRFEISYDIERFLKIEKFVYDVQPNVKSPNFDYIRHQYGVLNNYILLGICSCGDEDLAGGFIYVYGDNAFSVFGGAKKNDLGAGHFFYFELMKLLSSKGIKKFYFGQIANTVDNTNKKFSVGISGFKRGFSCVEIESASIHCVLKKHNYNLWQNLLKLYRIK